MAKVDWTEEGASLVKSGKYRYFSPEFMFQWKDPANGTEHKDVLLGGALTNRPFLKDMEPVAFSESGMGEVWMAENEGMSDDANYAPSVKHRDGSSYDPDGDGDDDSTTIHALRLKVGNLSAMCLQANMLDKLMCIARSSHWIHCARSSLLLLMPMVSHTDTVSSCRSLSAKKRASSCLGTREDPFAHFSSVM
jgi:Mu-like prophage I protein